MKNVKFPCIMVLVLAVVLNVNAQELMEWMEYSNNPVFGQFNGGPKAYYPGVCYDMDEFSGHGISAKYKMWYGTSSGRVGFAYSDDGISWNDLGLVVGDVNYHCKVLYDQEGFGGSSYYYKMWFADSDIWPYNIETIRYAESTDGINWVNDKPISQDSQNPLITGECGWLYGTYGPGTVLYNPDGYVEWHDDDPMGHRYVMYYDVATMNCIDGETESTALAYSLDGLYWKRYGDQPVILSGPDGAWDSLYVYAWSILRDDDVYHMWYSGGGSSSHEGIGYATSSNGIDWTRDSDNPIFHVDDGVDWRNERTYTPCVIKDGCTYKMWFSGKDSIESFYSIGYATTLPPIVNVDIDIKPRCCPNRLYVRKRGFIRIAILGTQDFNVNDVDISTVELEGVSPKRWRYRDVSTPVADPEDVCDCTREGRDGFRDLILKFKNRKIIAALGEVEDGDEVVLTLTGRLNDGSLIEGQDCVIIKKRKLRKSHSSSEPSKSAALGEEKLLINYKLFQNHPNPFNPVTTISFQLPKSGFVNLSIYNTNGHLVGTLINKKIQSGYHSIKWDGSNVCSGVYFYRLSAAGYSATGKCILLK